MYKKVKWSAGDIATWIIMHLDMDHFYTAVETREHPEIGGKPVIVGADPKGGSGRGVVSTSNYEARKKGVRSGMPISRAWKLCPEAVYLKPNFQLYIRVSKRIMNIARSYADKHEQWGLDEIFLNVSSRVRNFQEAERHAKRLKEEILEKEKLTCSVGIGPNKLIAKIASDFQKPDGLTVVRKEDAEKFLAPLPVRRLLWVGRKTEERLKDFNIRTIGDLAKFDPTVLTEVFGVMGSQLYLMAHGVDNSSVEERTKIKSISHETTFDEDTNDSQIILNSVESLSEEVAKEAQEQNLFFKTITVKVRYDNFETHTSSRTLSYMSNRSQDLKKNAEHLIQRYILTKRKIRLIGVRVSNFISGDRQQTLV